MTSLDDGWTIAFDLDGTLVDTAPDLIATSTAVLDQFGLPEVPDVILHPEISFGSRRMLERALEHLEETGHPVAATLHDNLDEMFDAFLLHYSANIAVHSKPFPLLVETLEDLRAQHVRVVVCTNKREDLSRQLLEALNMAHLFDGVAGRDTYEEHKPHPSHLLNVIADAGGVPEQAVMVGDSNTDILTAKHADIPVIGVTFGYTATPMTELEADAVISSYAEFDAALARLVQ